MHVIPWDAGEEGGSFALFVHAAIDLVIYDVVGVLRCYLVERRHVSY